MRKRLAMKIGNNVERYHPHQISKSATMLAKVERRRIKKQEACSE